MMYGGILLHYPNKDLSFSKRLIGPLGVTLCQAPQRVKSLCHVLLEITSTRTVKLFISQ